VCFLSAVTAADNIIISAAKYYSIFLCVCLCLWAWYWTCFTSGLATGPQQRWRPVRGRTRIRGLKFSERLKECEHDGGRWPVVFVLLWRKVWSSSRSILINFDRRNQIRIDEPAVILQLISDNSQRERERLVLCYMVGSTLSGICSSPKKGVERFYMATCVHRSWTLKLEMRCPHPALQGSWAPPINSSGNQHYRRHWAQQAKQ
jgi:hypothetical protein